MQKEESDLLMAAVEATRDYVQSLTEINRTIRWDLLDFTRRIYVQPRQFGALTISNYCDHFSSFPLSDCMKCRVAR